MNFRSPVFLPVFLLFVFCAANAGATVKNVGPADNWCAAVNTAAPGDQVIFSPGTYTQACTITVNGSSGSPIVIGSASSSSTDRAVLAYAGSSANLFDLQNASFLTIRWLTFQNTQAGVDAIKVRAAHDIAIQANTFQNIGGISVSANAADSDRVSIVDNTFSNLKATALYLGCQDGAACHARDVDVERNLISGVTSSGVGYGMEVKLNSYGVVRDNTLYSTQGPGICVYGSNNGSPATIVEGNYVEGSATDAGINIAGGPASVRNNIAVGNYYGGIYAQNYGSRYLQQNVWIVNNTVLNNGVAGILTQSWTAGAGNVLAYNAIAPRTGTVALSPAAPAATVAGNITCSPATACFDQPSSAPYDLWPLSAGALVDAAGSGTESWRPADDFMGVVRTTADVGAFERTSGTAPLVGGGTARPPRIDSSTNSPSPTASITSPVAGATVSRVVAITASASNANSVSFYVDGVLVGQSTVAPYSVDWNSASVADGAHTITAQASNGAGQTAVSSPVSVFVSNADTVAPSVAITSPANGATVTKNVSVVAAASDNLGVVGVQFYLDGVSYGPEATSAPYAVNWNTKRSGRGTHTWYALARDAAGNRSTSAQISVSVR